MALLDIARKQIFTLAEARLFAARRCIAPVGRDHCGDHVVDRRASDVKPATLFCVTHLAVCHEEARLES